MSYQDPAAIAAADIPAAPWHLSGSACASLWRMPTARLPVAPNGMEYASVAGHSLVLTVWAAYTDGTAIYDELAVVIPVRGQGMLAMTGTVPLIWVDDPIACAGGRQLWNIPKQMAEFETVGSTHRGTFTGEMMLDGQKVASMTFEPKFELPGRPGMGGFVVQPGDHGPVRTRCRARGKTMTGSAEWDFAPAGPLGFLVGRRPLVSARVWELQASFGT